jgi:hypothetical protein
MPTRSSGFFVQSTFTARNVGNFEVTMPRSDLSGFVHGYRNNDLASQPWQWNSPVQLAGTYSAEFGANTTVEFIGGLSLIQSNLSDHLEAVGCVQVCPPSGPRPLTPIPSIRVALFYREGLRWMASSFWDAGTIRNPLFTYPCTPAFVQGSSGRAGNFEVIIPLATGGFTHFYRNNDLPGLPWSRTVEGAAHLGPLGAVTLIESDYHDHGGQRTLEAVVRAGNRLYHLFRNGSWSHTVDPFFSRANGQPGFIQGRNGANKRNFEVVTPLQDGGMQHIYRDNDDPRIPWREGAIFGKELGQVEKVSLIQSNIGGNLEVLASCGGHLFHYYRTGHQWVRSRELPPVP